jgi:hypothetical protein
MRCSACGDVIGSYEPLVLLGAGGARETSAAAEPDIRDAQGEYYHRNCYTGTLNGAASRNRSSAFASSGRENRNP